MSADSSMGVLGLRVKFLLDAMDIGRRGFEGHSRIFSCQDTLVNIVCILCLVNSDVFEANYEVSVGGWIHSWFLIPFCCRVRRY